MSEDLDTSVFITSHSPPRFLIFAEFSKLASRSISAITIFDPFSENFLEIPPPIPKAPPVTIVTFPEKFIFPPM